MQRTVGTHGWGGVGMRPVYAISLSLSPPPFPKPPPVDAGGGAGASFPSVNVRFRDGQYQTKRENRSL
jgi:hypothetical protein